MGAPPLTADEPRVVIDATPLVSLWSQTGVARWTREILVRLGAAAPGWKVSLLALGKDPGDVHISDRHVIFTARYLPGRVQRLLLVLGLVPPTERWVPDADVMLGSAFVPWPTRKAATVPVIHDLCFIEHPELVSRRNRFFLRAMVRRRVRDAAVVITVSGTMRAEIMQRYEIPKERVAVVPNGCDLTLFNPGASRPAVASLPERYILFVGTLEPRKNLVAAIDAHSSLRLKRSDVPPLVVAGKEGWRRSSWEPSLRAAVASGDVVHLGSVDDRSLAGLYAGADMLIFPSHYEGFGLPVLEAMACGCPVVASDLPVLREVAADAALFVQPRADEIASGITVLLEDRELRKRLQSAGLERAKTFSWEESARRLVAAVEATI